MDDSLKTNDQLIAELEEMRRAMAREQAAERVRAEALAMRSTDDLAKVVVFMFQEMLRNGVNAPGCNIGFVDEDAGLVRHYFALENPRKYGVSWTFRDLTEVDDDVAVGIWKRRIRRLKDPYIDRWRSNTAWTSRTDDSDRRFFTALLGFDRDLPTTGEGWALTTVPFTNGWVTYRQREYSQESEVLVKEMSEALSLGFVRFLDFTKLDEERRKRIEELEEELTTARELQMAMMPKSPPRLAGFDIAGRCIPATDVGGDLYQFFTLPRGRLAISMADATGHSMEAAIPVVMFSGILRSLMEMDSPMGELLNRLNQSLYSTLDRRTFVCLSQGELDSATRTMRVSNGGCPYPYHYKAASGTVEELRLDAYPLGVSPETTYDVLDVKLERGDRVVFCSDGIIEAGVPEQEVFGFTRTAETIRQLSAKRDRSSEELIDGLIGEVSEFAGNISASDDMTCVVVTVE